jgi:hypothetical protein
MSMSQWLLVRGRPLFANAEIPGDQRNPELFRLSGIAEQVMGVLVNIDVDDLSKAVTSYQRAAGLRIAGGVGSARSFAPHHLPAHDPPHQGHQLGQMSYVAMNDMDADTSRFRRVGS